MRKFLVIILIAFCNLFLWGHTLKYSSSKVIIPISDEEYKVYMSVISKEKGLLVIMDKTNIDKESKNIKLLEKSGFINFFKQIKPETMADFLAKNDESGTLEKKFSPEINYILISIEKLKENFAYKFDGEMNWDTFREKFPEASNIYTLSRVGFSQDNTEALVFVTNWCGYLCGEGNYYILNKENGQWKINYKRMTWIS